MTDNEYKRWAESMRQEALGWMIALILYGAVMAMLMIKGVI